MPKHIRKCVSLPPELGRRMEAAGTRMAVNWSRIARRAWEEELNRMYEPGDEIAGALEQLDDLAEEIRRLRDRFESVVK